MPGRASARVEPAHAGAGSVAVLVPGQSALAVLDGRAPGFSPEQVEEAERKLAERSGPIVARVRCRTEESWGRVRGELNQVAGGQASARVMVLAHHALLAHQALVLQSLAAGQAFGSGDELQEKHMRNQAGLAVVASDCLNKAYEAAREEAKASQGSATDQLMSRLGVTAPGQNEPKATPVQGGSSVTHGSRETWVADDPASVPPADGPGGMRQGAPTQQNHPPKTGTPK